MSASQAPRPEIFRRRFAVTALIVAIVSVALTSVVLGGNPRVRAGAVRTMRRATVRIASIPALSARLRVPFLPQEHALSCEIATLRMALAYRGNAVTEAELLKKVGTDPTPHRGGVWGDPDEAFVGDVDGRAPVTGYGVHAGPIGRVAGEYRRAEVIERATPAMLADAIAHGNPVIIWGYVPGRGRPVSWKTPAGKTVQAVDGEHTRIVVGYAGTTEKPTGFLVIDPIYGEQYWPVAKFVRNWESLGKTGVVVY
ncbi:C39 family peptidase [Candidatus Uhrbacteria bacterium]|nr:C39 family peptidase [Candidatus Uhrbacteria bacterium]